MPLPSRSSGSTFGALNKLNNTNIPPANPVTDWDNTQLAPGICDIAALGQTAPRFFARLTLAATTGALVLLNWKAVWGNVTTTTPVLGRTSQGIFTITLPTTISNEYDASLGTTNNITLNLLAAKASLETNNSQFGFSNASASGNIITINIADNAASLSDLVGKNVFVVAY